jgi:hypothetical protein
LEQGKNGESEEISHTQRAAAQRNLRGCLFSLFMEQETVCHTRKEFPYSQNKSQK